MLGEATSQGDTADGDGCPTPETPEAAPVGERSERRPHCSLLKGGNGADAAAPFPEKTRSSECLMFLFGRVEELAYALVVHVVSRSDDGAAEDLRRDVVGLSVQDSMSFLIFHGKSRILPVSSIDLHRWQGGLRRLCA